MELYNLFLFAVEMDCLNYLYCIVLFSIVSYDVWQIYIKLLQNIVWIYAVS